ncbi:MAG: hypothetical protein QW451_01320 [Candidatus Aenigmatarchaeota archaeon]
MVKLQLTLSKLAGLLDMTEENSWMVYTLLAKSRIKQKSLLEYFDLAQANPKSFEKLREYVEKRLKEAEIELNKLFPTLQELISYKGVKRIFTKLKKEHEKSFDVVIENSKNLETSITSFSLVYYLNSLPSVLVIDYKRDKPNEPKIKINWVTLHYEKISQGSLKAFLSEFNFIIESLYDLGKKLNVSSSGFDEPEEKARF